jgi:hypothetical protein
MSRYLDKPPDARPPEPDIQTRIRTSPRLKIVIWSLIAVVLIGGAVILVVSRLV